MEKLNFSSRGVATHRMPFSREMCTIIYSLEAASTPIIDSSAGNVTSDDVIIISQQINYIQFD